MSLVYYAQLLYECNMNNMNFSWLKLNFWRGKYYCDVEVATLHNKKEENKEIYSNKFILQNKSFLQVMDLKQS